MSDAPTLARMLRTVVDPHGYGQATRGKVYSVLEVDKYSVTLKIPSRKKGVPTEFIVGLEDVELIIEAEGR